MRLVSLLFVCHVLLSLWVLGDLVKQTMLLKLAYFGKVMLVVKMIIDGVSLLLQKTSTDAPAVRVRMAAPARMNSVATLVTAQLGSKGATVKQVYLHMT